MKTRFVILLIALIGVSLAPFFAPYDPLRTQPALGLSAPSEQHALGTDLLGRDVLSRALYGAPRTLGIALVAASIALVLGIGGAIVSTCRSRIVSDFADATINAFLAFPGLAMAFVVVTLLGAGGFSVILAAAFTQAASTARIVRAALIQVRESEYTLAARSLGGTEMWIARRYFLPNVLPTLMAYFGVLFSYCLLNSAALTFLGLGGDPSVPDWGAMLSEGRAAFRSAPLVAFVPGMGITASVLFVQWFTRSISDLRG